MRGDTGDRDFVSRCPDGVWCLDLRVPVSVSLPPAEAADLIVRTGRVTTANDAAAGFVGRHRGYELIGRRLTGLLVHDAGHLRAVVTDFLTHGCRTGDLVLPAPAGHDGGGLVHSLTGVVEHGALVRIWGVQRQVTARSALLESFQRVQKMATMGHIAASVVHDFNNLLTAMMGYGEMVLDALEPGSSPHADMTQVLRAALRAEGLTRQLLLFSRRQRQGPEVFDLNVALTEFEPLLRRLLPEHVGIAIELSEAPALVRANRGQLELAIMNLALNARDAMPDGGHVTLSTIPAAGDGAPDAAGATVRLTVRDTGAGIAPAVRARIFEPFFTTRPGGIGLGLAIVQAIVEQNRGRIEVTSEPGRGSAFTMVLPALAPEGQDKRRAATVSSIERYRSGLGG